ncbi:HSP20-like chaperone [Lentinula detonsa]|uniref:HSP20-like chaperone n=1 Tax=Lentinula detonsa TaxID=2804962 RepID=A0AA38PV57_9AGAR|nr:HSP20-like chaperone [Lentinula detonsa]
MSIYFYEPFYNFNRAFDRFFETTFPQNGERSDGVARSIHPKMVTATFELPGLRKEDVNVDVHDSRLTISGETKPSPEHREEGYAVRERKSGRFSCMLRLPRGVNEQDIKASMEDGVLTVIFPKVVPEAQPKKITIS